MNIVSSSLASCVDIIGGLHGCIAGVKGSKRPTFQLKRSGEWRESERGEKRECVADDMTEKSVGDIAPQS